MILEEEEGSHSSSDTDEQGADSRSFYHYFICSSYAMVL